VAQAGVEVFVGQSQRIHVACAKLDVVDPVFRRIASRVRECVLIEIDPDDLSGDLCQTDGNRAFAAADIKDARGRRRAGSESLRNRRRSCWRASLQTSLGATVPMTRIALVRASPFEASLTDRRPDGVVETWINRAIAEEPR
jgi:hypothetical protein